MLYPTTTNGENTHYAKTNPMSFIFHKREKIKPVSETYDRTDPTQRRDRRLEEKLVEGRPLDKFKLNVERGNTGTPVSELFHKAK